MMEFTKPRGIDMKGLILKYQRRLIGILGTLSVLFTAAPAWANLQMDFYTYNTFDPVVSAFQEAALMFSDSNYMGLFFSIVVAGILFGGIAAIFLMLKGAKPGAITFWALPVSLGVVLFFSFIVPKGTVHVYDQVKNRYQAVGGVPDGLVFLAGTTNLIERGLVDIVQSASDPVGYQYQAGGIGFDMIYGLHSKGVLLSDYYTKQTVRKYTEDCVFFELQNPNGTMSENDINSNSDMLTLYQKAQNPNIYTVVYKDDTSTCSPPGTGNNNWRYGCTESCTDAYNAMVAAINDPTKYDKQIKTTCAAEGFDPTNPQELNQCKAVLSNLVSWFEGAAWEQVGFLKQTMMAQQFNDSLIAGSPDVSLALMANRNTGSSLLSAGMMANQWIPIIKGVLVSAAIIFTPLLVLFIPTPLVGKAISGIAGFFIWIMFWGVVDATLHSLTMKMAYKTFEEVRSNQLGLLAVSNFGTASLKALAQFGAIRWAGLALSTVLTGMLVKFGGHTLAMIAGNITGAAQGSASSAGISTQTPEGHAQSLRQNWDVMPTEVMANRPNSWGTMTQAKTNQMANQTGSGLAYGNADNAFDTGYKGTTMGAEGIQGQYDAYGGDRSLMRATAQWNSGSNIASTAKERALYGNVANKAAVQYGNLEGELSAVGGDPQKLADLKRLQGEGATASEIEGARERMAVTGEDFRTAFIGNKVDGARWQAIQNRAHGKSLDDYGAANVMRTTWQAEGKKVGNAEAERVLGGAAGYDLNTPQGVVDFSKNQKLATGREANFQIGGDRRERFQKMLDESGIKGVTLQDGDMVGGLRMGADGKPAEFSVVGNGRRIDFNGSTITERKIEDGLSWETIKDREGNVVSSLGRGQIGEGSVIAEKDAEGKKIIAGQGVEVVSHAGQKVYTGTFMQGGKLVSGSVTDDGKGHIVFADTQAGKSEQHKMIDKHIKDTRAYNASGSETVKGNKTTIDNSTTVSEGLHYNLGNDTLSMFIDNNPTVLAKGYAHNFRGNVPTQGGRVLVDHIAKQMGGYGKIAQETKDSLAASLSGGIDIGKTFWGKTLGIKAGMSTEAQRQAIESINANAVSTGMQNIYGNLMAQNKSSEWKVQQFTQFSNDIYTLINKQSTMNTAQQMGEGVDNPAKGQGVSGDHGNNPPHSAGNNPPHYTGNKKATQNNVEGLANQVVQNGNKGEGSPVLMPGSKGAQMPSNGKIPMPGERRKR